MKLLALPNELVINIAQFLDDEYCVNALHQTCKRFYLLLNQFLYELNVRNSRSCALEWAAYNGFENVARKVLKAGASPNASVYKAWLPMALACLEGHEAIVGLLMDYGVDLSLTKTQNWQRDPDYEYDPSGDEDAGCPLILAAGRGHESVVRLLISRGVNPDIRSERLDDFDISGLVMAAKNGHLPVVELLLNLGCDPNIGGWKQESIMADAAYEGHLEVVRFLLERVPEMEWPGASSSALGAAAKNGHADIVDLLLSHGKIPTPSMTGYPLWPLIKAAQREHFAIVESLQNSMDLIMFSTRGEIDGENQRQLLLTSAACGWTEFVEDLLACDCSADFPDYPFKYPWRAKEKYARPHSYGRDPSPLALAAHRGHYDTVDFLLNNLPKETTQRLLNERDPAPLLLAIDGCHTSIVDLLLDKGADPNHLTDGKIPVFFKAVHTPEILEVLLKRGVNPVLGADFLGIECKESLYVHALTVGNLATVELLRSLPDFEKFFLAKDPSWISFLEAAANGGALTVKNLLEDGYQVVPGSPEVAKALKVVLSKADHATLTLLFEYELIGDLFEIDGKSVLALVGSPSGRDVADMAVTLDILLAHGIEIETKRRDRSPLHDLDLWVYDWDLFKLLLDRGADPLRMHRHRSNTLLARESKFGSRELVRNMLKSLDGRSIPIERLLEELKLAENKADAGLEYGTARDDVRPLLRRFYWRKRYQNSISNAA